MRTFEEIQASFNEALRRNDIEGLLRASDDLDGLSTPEARALASYARGHACRLRGEYPLALDHLHRALAMFEELGDKGGVAWTTDALGTVRMRSGDYPAALEYYLRALAMLAELNDQDSVATVTGNIGLVYNRIGDHAAALTHHHQALEIYRELGTTRGLARMYGNIAIVHFNTGDHEAALQHFQRALVLFEELGDRVSAALVIGNLIEVFSTIGQHIDAASLLQKLDDIQMDTPEILIQREFGRARLQRHQGDIVAARATLVNALSVAQQHTLLPTQAEVQKELRDLCQTANDFAGYIEHNNEYTRITEVINGKEATLRMAMQAKQREIDEREKEVQKHLAVLHSTLPKHVAERVARGEVVNDHYENATVIFLDIVGFTELSSAMSSQEVISLLDTIFTQCDAICEEHNVTKIKTIGDSYMCVSFDSVINAAHCALAMSRIKVRHEVSHSEGVLPVSHAVLFRLGMHCGPLTAGVIGTQRMQYDVWGDTVNVASRMESTGEAGRVHVSEAFALNVEEALVTIDRGSIDIKGKGLMKTYWLEHSTP
ncbi:MAG: tetratricopeptide repeat protein [Bacteroidetes bacterium]|nr:tetratricopeptide repeat protein [Bacteroidota bacterium]